MGIYYGKHEDVLKHLKKLYDRALAINEDPEFWRNVVSVYTYGEGQDAPDYSNEAVQIKYCLRYDYSYIFEYHLMYSHLLDKLLVNGKNNINVLSIGCGAGQDAYALLYELQLRGLLDTISVRYTGIDQAHWDSTQLMYNNAASNVSINYEHSDAIEYLSSKVNVPDEKAAEAEEFWKDIDVVMFPKSLCEMGDNFAQSLENANNAVEYVARGANIAKKDIYVMVSFPRQDQIDDINSNPPMKVYSSVKQRAVAVTGNDLRDEWRWVTKANENENLGDWLTIGQLSELERMVYNNAITGDGYIYYEKLNREGRLTEIEGQRQFKDAGNSNCNRDWGLWLHWNQPKSYIRLYHGIEQLLGVNGHDTAELHHLPRNLKKMLYAGFRIRATEQ